MSYPNKQEDKYKELFEKYPFPLSTFQKYAIEAVVEGNHVLVTAHTGSGKTLPSEFAIEHFVAQGKKVIYTSPIKALSNQKFYEFTNKYPHISFGVLTGDVKTNPEADVLIVTAEILLNTLYNKKNNTGMSLAFDMDFDNDLGCIVMDEVHYINDPSRGKVWEETLILLPLHVQLVMLSATIDAPEKFAHWVESRDTSDSINKKTVYLASTNHRVVPLTHYSFITSNTGIFKAIKDKDLEKQIRDVINKPIVIQSATGEFNEPHYHKMTKMLKLFDDKRVFIKRAHILNQICKYMVENNMLPALCFVLSRKQLEICAKEITTVLLEDDSKVGYIVRRECEQIIRKLPNYQEYLELPEYLNMVSLLEKGIAIHHAGITPVLREMVELLFAKGYIKLLFATETFSIGISFPIKTVVFTDCNKFDGNTMRTLYSYEYTQMAGRAGRRGIDTVGNVIHLNNLFKNVEQTGYRNMLHGSPQKLVSKFKISFNLILNLISIGNMNFVDFAKKSMIQSDIDSELGQIYYKISTLSTQLDNIVMHNSLEVVQEYMDVVKNVKTAVNKKKRALETQIDQFKMDYRNIEFDRVVLEKHASKKTELDNLQLDFEHTTNFVKNNVDKILLFLEEDGFITSTSTADTEVADTSTVTVLSHTGIIATQLREVHCLVFAQLLESKVLQDLSPRQLVGLFSCFTNCTVSDDVKTHYPSCDDKTLETVINNVRLKYDFYMRKEEDRRIDSGADYTIHYDLIDYCMQWCDCTNTQDCKILLQTLEHGKQVFLGEFVKALLKINNISSEMEKIAESCGEIAFLNKLREIPLLTLKFVATNQSLYI